MMVLSFLKNEWKLTPNFQGSSAPVCVLTGNDHRFVPALMAAWKCAVPAVPLCKAHPPNVIEYYVKDSKAQVIIATKEYADSVSGNSAN